LFLQIDTPRSGARHQTAPAGPNDGDEPTDPNVDHNIIEWAGNVMRSPESLNPPPEDGKVWCVFDLLERFTNQKYVQVKKWNEPVITALLFALTRLFTIEHYFFVHVLHYERSGGFNRLRHLTRIWTVAGENVDQFPKIWDEIFRCYETILRYDQEIQQHFKWVYDHMVKQLHEFGFKWTPEMQKIRDIDAITPRDSTSPIF
jgi:hypothetical protein